MKNIKSTFKMATRIGKMPATSYQYSYSSPISSDKNITLYVIVILHSVFGILLEVWAKRESAKYQIGDG